MASVDRPTRQTGNDVEQERGASLVEYALLIALIALVCVGAVGFLGSSLQDDYEGNTSSMFVD